MNKNFVSERELTNRAGRVATGTIISKIFGYIRDMLVANLFGVGMFSDIFYTAFRIPNFFRKIFGESSFSIVFIPIFSEYLHKYKKKEIQDFLNSVFSILLLILIIFSIIGILFSSLIVKIVAGGFTLEKLFITIELTKLMFPFIIFMCLSAFLLSILNTLHSFFIPALSPIFVSFTEIFYICIIAQTLIYEYKIKGLAVSIIFGSIICFFVQYIKFKKLGWNLKFKLNFKHYGIKKIFFLMIPSVISISVDQINILVDSRYASLLSEGSISVLYYANRLMQLPLSIFGFAIVSASLPIMSKAFIKHDIITFKNCLNNSIRLSMFTILPAMVGFMSIGLPIIRLLFEHGNFNFFGSTITNNALFYYSIGLPGYALSKIFVNAFYSIQNTKTPFKIAVFTVVLHVILCFFLTNLMDVGGLALATSLSSYFNLFLLVLSLKKYIKFLFFKYIYISFLKSLIASIFTGITAFYICKIFNNLFISVFCAVFFGFIIFIFISNILKSNELTIFFNMLNNKNK
jgi:putative peptidoglycan lipid II flippase